MNNILIAKETTKIIKERQYEVDGEIISLPALDYESVEVISPKAGEELLSERQDTKTAASCNISIVAADSFQAAKRYDNPLVMNFANAHKPGGGFEMGACGRCSYHAALHRANTHRPRQRFWS